MAQGALEGRVALVTGANTGIGRVTALELAKRGARVIVGVRSLDKVQSLLSEVYSLGRGSIVPLRLELGDFASIHAFATSVLARPISAASDSGSRAFRSRRASPV